MFERMMGSKKFGSFVVITSLLSILLEIGGLVVFRSHIREIPGGPLGVIFAMFVLFWFEVPTMSALAFMGIRISDKTLQYILGLQLLVSTLPGSLVAAFSGIVAGLLYRSNALPFKNFRLPSFVTLTCSRFLLPFLQTPGEPAMGLPSTARQQRLRVPPTHRRRHNSAGANAPIAQQISTMAHAALNQQAFEQRDVPPQPTVPVPPSESDVAT